MALMMGYVSNLGIPRSGEVLRAGTARTYASIPFEKGFGTIITERIIDLIMLLLIVLVALFLQTQVLLLYFESNKINPLLPLLAALILVFLAFMILKIMRRSSNSVIKKITSLIKGMVEGIISITKMQKKVPFILHTLFIWAMYFIMFYIMKNTVVETTNVGVQGMLLAFIAGAFAVSTTNGGIGVYPIAVGLVLSLYGISKENGEALGWIIWGSQTLFNLVIGGLSFLFISLLNSKKNT
ncbi:hypothetical protein GCM10009117_16920 [Gangjinia marincola]|uniref:Uncharacterized protein n=2 Tax=Gangjinia marincola TaxID=578463 RepID=A0ABN1MHC9_9FLAO